MHTVLSRIFNKLLYFYLNLCMGLNIYTSNFSRPFVESQMTGDAKVQALNFNNTMLTFTSGAGLPWLMHWRVT